MNKKKSRQAPGVSSSALQEAHDIFGDVEELLMRRKQDRAKSGMHDESGEWSERRLEDEFDPTILAEKYMTEKDERIRQRDVPERMQVQHLSCLCHWILHLNFIVWVDFVVFLVYYATFLTVESLVNSL